MSLALNMSTNIPEIIDLTKRDVFQLSSPQNDEKR